MIITSVIENKSNKKNIFGQYGLSLLIETDMGCVLLDCGMDEKTIQNYNTLQLQKKDLDAIVISHNHFDHIGGLKFFSDLYKHVSIYGSSDILVELYTKSFFSKRKVSRNDIVLELKDRFVFIDDCIQVIPNVFVCRIADVDKERQCKDKKLKLLERNKLIPDDFKHEVYITVIEKGQCKIVSSCSHNGVSNIINDAKKRFPQYPITAFVGGLHTRGKKSTSLNCKKKDILTIADEIAKIENFHLYTCHCTGKKAFNIIKSIVGKKCSYFSSGEIFEV